MNQKKQQLADMMNRLLQPLLDLSPQDLLNRQNRVWQKIADHLHATASNGPKTTSESMEPGEQAVETSHPIRDQLKARLSSLKGRM